MDPDTLLKDLLEVCESFQQEDPDDDDPNSAAEVAEEVTSKLLALDMWLRTGGFLPRRWRQAQ